MPRTGVGHGGFGNDLLTVTLEKRTGSIGFIKGSLGGVLCFWGTYTQVATISSNGIREIGGTGHRLYPINLKRLGLEGWVARATRGHLM